MTRLARRIAAAAAIAALAFAQLAVSAHACPSGMGDHPAATMTAAGDCDEMPSRSLCERHCDYGSSSVDSHASVPVAPGPVRLAWRVEPPREPAAPSAAAARPFERRIERPPLTLFGVLRI